jgi:hypothetical protein
VSVAQDAMLPVQGKKQEATERWKRPYLAIAVGVLVVVVATVLVDLPVHASPASRRASAIAAIKQINSDIAPCSYALGESLRLYADVSAGGLSSSDRAEVPGLVDQDYAACSFTDQSVVDLASINQPNSSEGRALNSLVNETVNWADPGALRVIGEVAALLHRPTARNRAALETDEVDLNADASKISATVAGIDRLVRSKTPTIEIARAS